MIYSRQIIRMICRALSLMDDRMIDHGVKVAAVMKDMLEASGIRDQERKKNLCILSLCHDIGAYRISEIDNLVQVETLSAWEHSIYGYLFLREFAPFEKLAGTVLYHHANANQSWDESEEVLRYAQMMHVADRAEIWHRKYKGENIKGLYDYLKARSGTAFSKEAVDLFIGANEQFDTFAKLNHPIGFEEIIDFDFLEEDKVRSYLWMLVHAIDFRSRFTVTHTVGVVEIAQRLAARMGLSKEEQEQIYYGALLHDIGKIGTPVSILEKEGKLTDEEMEVMRQHINLTAAIIQGCVEKPIERIALYHHEKLNGSGYPLGLTGDEINLPERIMAVADIVSALSMKRSYKEAFPKEKVFAILHQMVDKNEIDGGVVENLKSGYDEILAEAEKVCIPIRKIHDQISAEYERILKIVDEKK